MATWEDGPEYAPLERPAEFSLAAAPALEVVPPAEQSAAQAPKDRPAFEGPQAPVAPLATLIPTVADQRDPIRPFDVVSSTVTSMDSAWGAAHWSPPSGPPVGGSLVPAQPQLSAPVVPYATPTGAGSWVPPTTTPWPPPTSPFPPPGGPAQLPGGYPPPGTNQWFGPGPGVPQQSPVPPVDAKAVASAATPGLLICLAIGGLIYIFAPIMLAVAFFLSQRVRVAHEQVRRAFVVAMSLLGVSVIAGYLVSQIWFTSWWHFIGVCALILCWALLATTLVLVYRGLKQGPTTPPYSSNWG